MNFLLWLAETALGGFVKGLWARFFPSVEERLGIEETENSINKERADVAEKRLDIANEPEPDVSNVVDWLSGRSTKH